MTIESKVDFARRVADTAEAIAYGAALQQAAASTEDEFMAEHAAALAHGMQTAPQTPVVLFKPPA